MNDFVIPLVGRGRHGQGTQDGFPITDVGIETVFSVIPAGGKWGSIRVKME